MQEGSRSGVPSLTLTLKWSPLRGAHRLETLLDPSQWPPRNTEDLSEHFENRRLEDFDSPILLLHPSLGSKSTPLSLREMTVFSKYFLMPYYQLPSLPQEASPTYEPRAGGAMNSLAYSPALCATSCLCQRIPLSDHCQK